MKPAGKRDKFKRARKWCCSRTLCNLGEPTLESVSSCSANNRSRGKTFSVKYIECEKNCVCVCQCVLHYVWSFSNSELRTKKKNDAIKQNSKHFKNKLTLFRKQYQRKTVACSEHRNIRRYQTLYRQNHKTVNAFSQTEASNKLTESSIKSKPSYIKH